MIVRKATFEDIPKLVQWGERFHAMSFFQNYRFSPNGTKNFLTMMIRSPSCTVLMHDYGLIGGSIDEFPFCNVRVAKEIFWYAERDGTQLLKAFSDWAILMNVDVQLISSIEIPDRNTKAIRRLLNMNGYHAVEETYVKESR